SQGRAEHAELRQKPELAPDLVLGCVRALGSGRQREVREGADAESAERAGLQDLRAALDAEVAEHERRWEPGEAPDGWLLAVLEQDRGDYQTQAEPISEPDAAHQIERELIPHRDEAGGVVGFGGDHRAVRVRRESADVPLAAAGSR